MESELIAWLRQRLPRHPSLMLGPGDDAAVLRLANGPDCLLTVDMLSDGVDFDLRTTDPRRIGHKALGANLSDIAAMAGKPLAAVVALLLPRNGLELAKELYEGLLPLAERFDVSIAGGDINSWDGPLAISVTVIGQPTSRGPLLRSGAKPGDAIVVTGEFGGSILGRHLDVEPRIDEAILLHEGYELHAGMDVSDGLSLDLSRLCQESRCGAEMFLDQVPVSAAARELSKQLGDGRTPLEHALSDGEDFELLLAVPHDEAHRMLRERPLKVKLSIVGRFVETPGLRQRDSIATSPRPLAAGGWQHQ